MTRSRWHKLKIGKTEHKIFIHLPDGGRVVWDPRTETVHIEVEDEGKEPDYPSVSD